MYFLTPSLTHLCLRAHSCVRVLQRLFFVNRFDDARMYVVSTDEPHMLRIKERTLHLAARASTFIGLQ